MSYEKLSKRYEILMSKLVEEKMESDQKEQEFLLKIQNQEQIISQIKNQLQEEKLRNDQLQILNQMLCDNVNLCTQNNDTADSTRTQYDEICAPETGNIGYFCKDAPRASCQGAIITEEPISSIHARSSVTKVSQTRSANPIQSLPLPPLPLLRLPPGLTLIKKDNFCED